MAKETVAPEAVEETVDVVVETPAALTVITHDFLRADLNELRDAVNVLIKRANA